VEQEFKEWRITEEDAAEMEAAMVVKSKCERIWIIGKQWEISAIFFFLSLGIDGQINI